MCSWAAVRMGRRGVTAVEYGIMAAMITTVLVTAMTTFGDSLTTCFGNITAHITAGN